MPVIFSTPTSHRVFMFDKDAHFMLKAMKTSGNIPGALYPEDVKGALEALKSRIELEVNDQESSLSANTSSDANSDIENDSDDVKVNTKALPLIELMQKAINQNEKLIWDKG